MHAHTKHSPNTFVVFLFAKIVAVPVAGDDLLLLLLLLLLFCDSCFSRWSCFTFLRLLVCFTIFIQFLLSASHMRFVLFCLFCSVCVSVSLSASMCGCVCVQCCCGLLSLVLLLMCCLFLFFSLLFCSFFVLDFFLACIVIDFVLPTTSHLHSVYNNFFDFSPFLESDPVYHTNTRTHTVHRKKPIVCSVVATVSLSSSLFLTGFSSIVLVILLVESSLSVNFC